MGCESKTSERNKRASKKAQLGKQEKKKEFFEAHKVYILVRSAAT